MTEIYQLKGNRIDTTSQMILIHLYDSTNESSVSSITDSLSIGLEQPYDVTRDMIQYRIREHLIPADLVEITQTESMDGIQNRHIIALTDEGRHYTRQKRDEFRKPPEFDNIQEFLAEFRAWKDFVHEWTDVAERYMKATRLVLANECDIDFEKYLDEVSDDN